MGRNSSRLRFSSRPAAAPAVCERGIAAAVAAVAVGRILRLPRDRQLLLRTRGVRAVPKLRLWLLLSNLGVFSRGVAA